MAPKKLCFLGSFSFEVAYLARHTTLFLYPALSSILLATNVRHQHTKIYERMTIPLPLHFLSNARNFTRFSRSVAELAGNPSKEWRSSPMGLPPPRAQLRAWPKMTPPPQGTASRVAERGSHWLGRGFGHGQGGCRCPRRHLKPRHIQGHRLYPWSGRGQ